MNFAPRQNEDSLCVSRMDLRAKGKALTRARKQLEEGNIEISALSVQSSELDLAVSSMEARINELEVRPARNVFYVNNVSFFVVRETIPAEYHNPLGYDRGKGQRNVQDRGGQQR